jgi:Flp pilus assembly protein TadG
MWALSGKKEIGRTKAEPDNSGQALVEFTVSAVVLLTLVFAVIDFGRAIYEVEVLKNLTGEGSAMASRGTTLSDTATAVVAAASPLNLSVDGRVIVTSVLNNNNSLKITGQATQGGIVAGSKVGVSEGRPRSPPVQPRNSAKRFT